MANSIYTSNESLGIKLDDISNDVIVIDTSDNRIGVNILEPHYSIDVRDFSDASGIIYTDYLKTGAIISDLTPDIDVCYNLGTQDKKWNEIHANYLEVSGIKIKDASQFILGSGTGGDAIVFPSDISVNGDISCVNLNVDGITIKDASKFTIGSGSGDTNGIEFMANTTISGDLTITGNINSSYITNLLSASTDIQKKISLTSTSIINQNDYYGLYRGQELLSDYTTGDIGIESSGLQQTFIVSVQNSVFYIDSESKPPLTLYKNTLYTFDLSNVDLASHPFRIYTDNTRTIEYQGAVIDGSFLYLTVTDSVTSLYYGCENHSGMGNYITIDVVYRKFNIRFKPSFQVDAVKDISNYNILNLENNFTSVLTDNNQTFSIDFSSIIINESYDRYKTVLSSSIVITNNSTNDILFELVIFKNGLQHITYDTSVNSNTEITATIDRLLQNNTYAQDDRLSIGMLMYQVSDQENINYQYNQISTELLRDFSYDFSMQDLEYTSRTFTEYEYTKNIAGKYNWYSDKFNSSSPTIFTESQILSSHQDDFSTIELGIQSNPFFDVVDNEIIFKQTTNFSFDISLNIYNIQMSTGSHNGGYNQWSFKIKYQPVLYVDISNNQDYTSETNIVLSTEFNPPFGLGGFSADGNVSVRLNKNYDNIKNGTRIKLKTMLFLYVYDTTTSQGSNTFNTLSTGLNQLYTEYNTANGNWHLTHHIDKFDYDISVNINYNTSNINDINLNFNTINLSVEKSVDPPPDFNYNITVMNNSVLNNQDIYSKYRATNVLTDFSNQNVGFNPDYNETFTVVTMGSSYIKAQNSQITVSSTFSGNKSYMVDNDAQTQWVGTTTGPESVTIDFGETKTVAGLRIIVEEKRLTDFTLTKSSDGSNFDTIQTFSGFSNSSESTTRTYTLNLSNIHNTRYIKLSNMNSTTYGNVGINDLEILVLDSTYTTNVSYIINDEIQPDLSLNIDTPYIFDLTNVSASHPFNIYTDVNSTSLYTGAVIDGSFIYLTIDSATTALYYNCSNHSNMRGLIDVINTGYHNFNVKFIGDTNNIVRSDLLEYNRFDLTSGKFNTGSTSGYANSVDSSGVIVGVYGEYYDIDASLNLTVTNTSVYDVSLDFVLLQNNVVLYSQTINVDSSLTSQDILINSQLSRLTMFRDDTVNFAFLPYIQHVDGNNYSVNNASAASYQQIDLDINVNSFNLVVSAPDYEELEVGNLLTANNIDVSNIDVSNIDIKNTLTIASETPTNGGDSLVFDGNKLTWKNAIIDVREYIPTNDPVTQYSSTIYGNDYNYLGNSVAINSSGTRIVMGGAQMGSGTNGLIQVFEYKNGDWIQLGNTLVGDTNDEFGTSVGMNSEGTRIIVGAPCSNNNHQGYANVYDFSLTTNDWVKIGPSNYTLEGDTHSDSHEERWGQFVAINGSGNRVAFSSPQFNDRRGRVKIYNLSNGQYDLDASLNGENSNNHFGFNIKFSDSGNRLVLGAPYYDTNVGKFYFYEKSTNGNWAINQSYIAGQGGNYTGENVNISGDGKVLMYGENYQDGRVMIGRELSDGTFIWYEFNMDSGNNNPYIGQSLFSNFGNRGSITVNENGSRIAIGSSELGSGRVIVFDYSFQTQQYTYKWHLHRTTPSDTRFGTSLDITNLGEFLIIGAPYKSTILNGQGDVHVYKINELVSSGTLYYETTGNDAYILKIQP